MAYSYLFYMIIHLECVSGHVTNVILIFTLSLALFCDCVAAGVSLVLGR